METITKAVGLVATTETDETNGAFEVILSAATLDRDGEVIDSRAFEPLPDHIPFDIDHDMTVTKTIGSGVPFYAEDGSLRVKGTFASTALAQEVRSLVAEGHIRTTSVTFMAATRETVKGVPHVKRAELLNGTFTPVPSNRESVVLSSKSMQALTERAETVVGTSEVLVPAGVKSIIGSLEAQRDRVRLALSDAYPLRWAYIRGVLPDVVVFDVWGDEDCETWQQNYTDDGTAVTLTGEPTQVQVMEVVTAVADSVAEGVKNLLTLNEARALVMGEATTDADSKSADDAAEPAAPEAAGSAAKSAEDEEEKAAIKAAFDNADRFRFGS